MSLNKFDIQNDSPSKQALVAKGIEQAWRRHRFSYNIHSGVRVKVRQENYYSSFDRMQSMLKRLWIESETSALTQNGQKLITITNPSSLKRTRNQSEDVSLTTSQRTINPSSSNIKMNSIGIQTIMISRMNRQTSCDIIMPIKRNQKKRVSSSDSETSITKDIENSTETDSTSTESSSATSSENEENYPRYRGNKNRNNNAINTDVERRNSQIKIEKTITQLSNNEQLLGDINIKTQCYPQLTSSKGKRGFFGTFLHLFSFFRLSSFKHARIPVSTAPIGSHIAADTDHNEWNKNIRPPTSRCRRSAARNYNHSSSIQPEKHFSELKPEEDQSPNLNHFQHSISDKSLSVRKQTNNSSLSIIQKNVPHRSKKNSRKTNHRHQLRRKQKNISRGHHRKYLRRISYNSSHSQQKASATISTATIISPSSENVVLPERSKTILPQAKTSSHDEVLIEEKYPSNNYSSLPEEVAQLSITRPGVQSNAPRKSPGKQKQLSLKCIDNLITKAVPYIAMDSINHSNTLPSSFQKIPNEDKQCHSIRLRVKNKNLLSKSKIPPLSSNYRVDDSIQYHQRNIVNEFKSILQQTKNNHINNNASDDNPSVIKRDINEILTSSKINAEPIIFSIKNQNQRTSILSSDSQSITTEDTPANMNKLLQNQNDIIQDGIDQLKRYQNFAENYKLKSNKTIKQFLMKSTALSSESLYKLSIDKEPNPTSKIKKKL